MTKRSSLQLDAPTMLLDSISQPVPIGKQIGRGGEGSVFELQSDPSLVVKVYHKWPLPDDQVVKLQAMVSCWSSPLEMIAAWPRSILYDATSCKPCGILMTRMDDARPLHELYGTTNRRRHFPEIGWHHLVLAARNIAAAFQTLHAANILVGDVNQGNLLVDRQMCVRMIDCDSFQLTANGQTYACPVGTPHFTPPELQSQKLRDTIRTPNHDRFGLAVLIFHLLFVGRHPFAGRYRGPGDLSIERAIAERRFAFSKNRLETLVDPPPASLVLDDLPPGVANLFEAAFRSYGVENSRPTPSQWVQELESMMKHRKACRFDPIHVYSAQLAECPWCRIEDSGGPAFFVPAGGATTITADRLAALEYQIMGLERIPFADLPAKRLAIPALPALRTVKHPRKRTWPDWNAALLGISLVVCFAGAIVGGAVTLAAGAVLSVALAAALIVSKSAYERRAKCDKYTTRLQKGQQSLSNQARLISAQHRRREAAFDELTDNLNNEVRLFRTAHENLQDAIVAQRVSQKAEFLRSFSICDSIRRVRGLTYSQVAMLESYGVETANDIDQLRLCGIPTIEPGTVMELLQWRRELEPGFKFNPEHGITLADVGAAKEMAVRRFKISQARKILTGARQMATQADAAEDVLARGCAQFESAVECWKNQAKEFRDFQSRRRRSERLINRSPAIIAALGLGAPTVALLIYLLIG